MNDEVKRIKFQTAFHGETWYKCPWCGQSFEYYDMEFSRGFTKTDTGGVYIHECGNKVYRM